MEWWGWLSAALAGVVLLSNGIKALKDLLSPVRKISEVDQRERAHEKDAEAHFKEIDEALQQQEDTTQVILRALFHLVNHEIDGNGIEGLKKVRNELLNNITER